MADEIFVNGKPVLVVAEAVSHFVIAAQLSGGRDGDEWKEPFQGTQKIRLQHRAGRKGSGRRASSGLASFGVEGQADLKPFDVFQPRLERQAYAALERMYHGQEARSAKTPPGHARHSNCITQRPSNLRHPPSGSTTTSIIFTTACMRFLTVSPRQGNCWTKATARIELEVCLALMGEEFVKHQSILDAVKFIRRNVEDFWEYFERLEEILAHFGKTLPKQLLQSLVWQMGRKAMAVKDYRLSQLAKRAAEQKTVSQRPSGKTALKS
jgi:hypothetical protein